MGVVYVYNRMGGCDILDRRGEWVKRLKHADLYIPHGSKNLVPESVNDKTDCSAILALTRRIPMPSLMTRFSRAFVSYSAPNGGYRWEEAERIGPYISKYLRQNDDARSSY